MEIGEQNLALAHKLVFGFDWFFYLDDHFGYRVGILDSRQDSGAGCRVFVVAESAALTGCMLYIHGVAMGYEFFYTRGSHCHTILVVFDFFWYSDDHNERD